MVAATEMTGRITKLVRAYHRANERYLEAIAKHDAAEKNGSDEELNRWAVKEQKADAALSNAGIKLDRYIRTCGIAVSDAVSVALDTPGAADMSWLKAIA